jgi:alkanesulfonate monooxygenase SsuD/methylene tetrahydromethanopterin reductase-like flavin-dependent oxidoreductase (luciferase family)
MGCNFVTSTSEKAAQNFGLPDHIEHDLRYEMADEFVDVVAQLWSSWDGDAIVMDEETRIFVDHEKVHAIDFKGRFFASRGPLNTRVRRRGGRCWCRPAVRRKGVISLANIWTPSSRKSVPSRK